MATSLGGLSPRFIARDLNLLNGSLISIFLILIVLNYKQFLAKNSVAKIAEVFVITTTFAVFMLLSAAMWCLKLVSTYEEIRFD